VNDKAINYDNPIPFCFYLVYLFVYCLLFISLLLQYVMVNEDYPYSCSQSVSADTYAFSF